MVVAEVGLASWVALAAERSAWPASATWMASRARVTGFTACWQSKAAGWQGPSWPSSPRSHCSTASPTPGPPRQIEDPFVPLPDDLLVNLRESRPLVDALLDSLPQSYGRASQVGRRGARRRAGRRACGAQRWAPTSRAGTVPARVRRMQASPCLAACQRVLAHVAAAPQVESAMGPALQAAFLVMNHIGGKLLLFQVGGAAGGDCSTRCAPSASGGGPEALAAGAPTLFRRGKFCVPATTRQPRAAGIRSAGCRPQPGHRAHQGKGQPGALRHRPRVQPAHS